MPPSQTFPRSGAMLPHVIWLALRFLPSYAPANDVRSNDIQRTILTTVNDIFLTKIMKLEWPDKR